jgi:hypothetical protein
MQFVIPTKKIRKNGVFTLTLSLSGSLSFGKGWGEDFSPQI